MYEEYSCHACKISICVDNDITTILILRSLYRGQRCKRLTDSEKGWSIALKPISMGIPPRAIPTETIHRAVFLFLAHDPDGFIESDGRRAFDLPLT